MRAICFAPLAGSEIPDRGGLCRLRWASRLHRMGSREHKGAIDALQLGGRFRVDNARSTSLEYGRPQTGAARESRPRGPILSDPEFRELARLLITVQALLPSIFFVGLLEGPRLFVRSLARTLAAHREWEEETKDAVKKVLSAVFAFSLFLIFIGVLFGVAIVEIVLCVRDVPSDPRHFVVMQGGIYVVLALIATVVCVFMALEQARIRDVPR